MLACYDGCKAKQGRKIKNHKKTYGKVLRQRRKEIARSVVIARYFRQSDEKLEQFMAGCKGLTDADKDELALGAAKELGLRIEMV